MEESGASNVDQVGLIARLDQEAAEVDEMLTRVVSACRLDLADGHDPLRITEAMASAAIGNGPAYGPMLFARAVLRLARQDSTR